VTQGLARRQRFDHVHAAAEARGVEAIEARPGYNNNGFERTTKLQWFLRSTALEHDWGKKMIGLGTYQSMPFDATMLVREVGAPVPTRVGARVCWRGGKLRKWRIVSPPCEEADQANGVIVSPPCEEAVSGHRTQNAGLQGVP
jgi:hypothetical protein